MQAGIEAGPDRIAATALPESCFHCGLPIPDGFGLSVDVDGAPRPVCCPGCRAVAEAIVGAGHAHYYRSRTELPLSAQARVPGALRAAEVYDSAPLQRQLVHRLDEHAREASLILEGITCAACVWLNERQIVSLPGVEEVRVNYATQRAWVRWDERRIRLSEILRAIEQIGYRALPYDSARQQARLQGERRRQQRRLAIAGLFGMQVMMLSVSLYAGAWSGIEREFEQFFRWLALLLTLPVVGYSALPFFGAAWRDLARRRASMDLPVALAIAAAFGASAYATGVGHGEVYFDSVVMFVFLLSASRLLESIARHRCAGTVEKLVQSIPLTATRLDAHGGDEIVAAATLEAGDRLLVRPGETIPADGELLDGETDCDESLLNGESDPVGKRPGDSLLGGSINLRHPLRMRVTAAGADTVVAEIQRLAERAQAEKPPLAQLADRIAARFVAAVLLLVAVVAAVWWQLDSERAFEIALAALIVSCPCALSLATPTALSAALGRMQAAGLLVRRGDVLERLGRVSHVVFDKTGTLTAGRPEVLRILVHPDSTESRCLELAAALERHSEHPLGRALSEHFGAGPVSAATAVVNTPGGGICGEIDGVRYCIGSREFVAAETGATLPSAWRRELAGEAASAVVLARPGRALALFTLGDGLRDGAAALVARLRERGKRVLLLTGDRAAAAARVAARVGIEDARAGLSPAQKMAAVRALQARGGRVLMIGDGINDAPVLAAADVSIAVGGATSLARMSADIVLLGERLESIDEALERAARTRRVIRQNLAWALGYNFGAIPAAAAGLVAPWLAALGMSLSSLLVVANALRLTR